MYIALAATDAAANACKHPARKACVAQSDKTPAKVEVNKRQPRRSFARFGGKCSSVRRKLRTLGARWCHERGMAQWWSVMPLHIQYTPPTLSPNPSSFYIQYTPLSPLLTLTPLTLPPP